MYFLYLRGKQFELLALREFASENPQNDKILPIIEPVKDSFNGITTATEIMIKEGLNFALVLNPKEGDFKKSKKSSDILNSIPILSTDDNLTKWIPAFIFNNNIVEIQTIIEGKNLSNVMLIFKNGLDTNNEDLFKFLDKDYIAYIVDGDASRSSKKKISILKSPKKLIRLDSRFEEQTRNVDYIGIGEQTFTEEFAYYKDEGYYGFSDYTTLPKNFVDGGMLPFAIAIHLTYEKGNDQILIQHFVSDTNFDQSNIQKKFFEAAKKVKDYFFDKNKTKAIEDLIYLFDNAKYPGLGVLKKLSIRNHLELLNRVL